LFHSDIQCTYYLIAT